MSERRANEERQPEAVLCAFLFDSRARCNNTRVAGMDFCMQHGLTLLHPIYTETAEHLRQDVREFWTRNNFFLVVEGALLAVFAGIDISQGLLEQRVQRFLPILGGLIAILWIWITSWSVHWIGRWHEALLRIEEQFDPWRSHEFAGRQIQRKSAIQGVAITIPILFTLAWIYVGWSTPSVQSSGFWILVLAVASGGLLAYWMSGLNSMQQG